MEQLLHYVWIFKLYQPHLTTTTGEQVTVIDAGIRNSNAGPDFFNAKIRIGATLWAGSIEIHTRSSDWKTHKHHTDKAYDSVILHVVTNADTEVYRTNGVVIPQLEITYPDNIETRLEYLLRKDIAIPCLARLPEIEPLHITSWMEALLSERLERKMQDILKLLEFYKQDWNEVFYILLSRNFGFGVNSDAFERLARSLPFRIIRKQRISITQVESLLFGQAGMLEETDIDCYHYKLLRREYQFLRHKYQLTPLDESLFKNLRIRPNYFPHLKLAQLAAIWMQHDNLFSVMLEAGTPRELKNCFRVLPSDYWETHYHFRHVSPKQEKPLGENALNIVLINTVVPLFFAYGVVNNRPEYNERALRLLESIPAERNHIVSAFATAGIRVNSACDSQALIQLKRCYCEAKKCMYCRIGFRLLKQL